MSISHRVLVVCALACGSWSCGAGSAAIVAGSGGDGGGTGNAPASLSLFRVESVEESPATIRFVVADNEGDPTSVELLYQVSGRALERMTAVPVNPVTPPLGVETSIEWDFSAEQGIGTTGLKDVLVVARVPGLPDAALSVSVGNDAPVLAPGPTVAEGTGIVPFPFDLSDSSQDVVSVRIEFRPTDPPDAPWTPARPGGLEMGQATPDPALVGIESRIAPGIGVVFFWDTSFDLPHLEREVALRFTPMDPFASGAPVETTLLVDNDERPVVAVDSGPLISNPDARRGIPVPFTATDQEGDLVQVFLQWRRPEQTFAALPDDLALVRALAVRPDSRRELQLCTPYARAPQGRLLEVGADSARLAELATGEVAALAAGVEGRTLELMRTPGTLASASNGWSANPLRVPAVALPLAAGTTALVLDASGADSTLREIELATGVVVRTLAALAGAPSTMAFERDERSVLVATELGELWSLVRVDVADGAQTPLFVSSPRDPPAPVRGLASLSIHGALLTAGSALVRLDWSESLVPRSVCLLDGLATPWGIVLDPVSADVVYLAERDRVLPAGRGRIAVVDLRRGSLEALPIVPGTIDLDRPESLALENHGTRLVAVTVPDDGPERRLVAIELGPRGRNRVEPLGEPFTAVRAALAGGPDSLRAVTLSDRAEILLAGGVEQRRTIESYDAARQSVVVERAFAPPAAVGRAWRFAMDGRVRASPAGVTDSFVWDSRDVPGGGPVFLRAVPFDTEQGVIGTTGAPSVVTPTYDVAESDLGTTLFDAVAADVDGDGAPDLVGNGAITRVLTILYQGSARDFTNASVLAGVPFPRALSVADVDRDGQPDIVCTSGTSVRVLFQTSVRSFGASVSFAGSLAAIADFDGDLDLDLVVAKTGEDELEVLRQVSARVFASAGAFATPECDNLLAADLDLDGDVDVASVSTLGAVSVSLQSDGVFTTSPTPLGAEEASPLAAADLDSDGRLDLAVAAICDGRLFVSFQVANGVFGPRVPFGSPELFGLGAAPIAADIDGDGDPDVLTENGSILLQDGALSDDVVASLARAVELAYDLDLDGNVDTFSRELAAFHSAPGADLGSVLLAVPRDGGADPDPMPERVVAADLDRNGVLDLAALNRTKLTIFFQAPAGVLDLAPLVLPRAPGDGLSAADVDGDGAADLVQGRRILFQTEPGAFGRSVDLQAAPTVVTHAAGDLDGDGDLDVVTAGATGDLTFHVQDGLGGFAPEQTLSEVSGTRALAALDVDADGRLDVAVASQSGLVVFFQDSDAFRPTAAASLDAHGLALGDIDGDGDLDLACTAATGTFVVRQTGERSFALPLRVAEPAETVSALDLDRDGDVDLVTNLERVRQVSPGRFEATPAFAGLAHVSCDFDADGDPDVAAAFDEANLSLSFGGR